MANGAVIGSRPNRTQCIVVLDIPIWRAVTEIVKSELRMQSRRISAGWVGLYALKFSVLLLTVTGTFHPATAN